MKRYLIAVISMFAYMIAGIVAGMAVPFMWLGNTMRWVSLAMFKFSAWVEDRFDPL